MRAVLRRTVRCFPNGGRFSACRSSVVLPPKGLAEDGRSPSGIAPDCVPFANRRTCGRKTAGRCRRRTSLDGCGCRRGATACWRRSARFAPCGNRCRDGRKRRSFSRRRREAEEQQARDEAERNRRLREEEEQRIRQEAIAAQQAQQTQRAQQVQ